MGIIYKGKETPYKSKLRGKRKSDIARPDPIRPIKYYFPDIDKALKILEELPKKYNKKVNELFQKLITKEPKHFDRYEKWKIKQKCKKL